MHGNAALRPVWHTFRVDASFDKQRGITGIGLILRATNKAGRDGEVVARFSEAYIGLPIQAGEQFAVFRALEIASDRGYRLLRVRSDYNQMRMVLKADFQAGVVQDEHSLRAMILRLAQKFDSAAGIRKLTLLLAKRCSKARRSHAKTCRDFLRQAACLKSLNWRYRDLATAVADVS